MEEVKFRDSKNGVIIKRQNLKILKSKILFVDIKNIGNGISFDDWSGLRGI